MQILFDFGKKTKDFLFSLKRKTVFILVFILVVVGFFIFKNNKNQDFSFANPTFGDFSQTVKATGQVTSETDLSLSFDKSGKLRVVNVKVGDKVTKGQILASLESENENARFLESRASLASAKARLQKVVEGSTNEELNLAQVLLQNAERDYENVLMNQNVLVENAYRKLISSSLELKSLSNASVTTPALSGSLNKLEEGEIRINFYSTGNGIGFSSSGIVKGVGEVTSSNPVEIGTSGLYLTVSSSSGLSGTEWAIEIPNKKASDYVTNKNAYDASLKTKESAISSALSLVEQRRAELQIKKATARTSDVLLAEADVMSAEARVKDAEANLNKNVLRAPVSGVITKVDVKIGEIAQAQKAVFGLEDVSSLYVESNINESSIAKVSLGQKVLVTFDALTSSLLFEGEVVSIDPSSDSEEGVVNYKTKVVLKDIDQRVKPGMNSEITIIIFEEKNVLSIPETAVSKKDAKNYVSVLVDEVKKTTKEVEVVLGERGDGNMVKVVSGISVSDKIVLKNTK